MLLTDGRGEEERFDIDIDAVSAYREQLEAMAAGIPIAAAAIKAYSDWEVVRAIERLWRQGRASGRGSVRDGLPASGER